MCRFIYCKSYKKMFCKNCKKEDNYCFQKNCRLDEYSIPIEEDDKIEEEIEYIPWFEEVSCWK